MGTILSSAAQSCLSEEVPRQEEDSLTKKAETPAKPKKAGPGEYCSTRNFSVFVSIC